MSRPKLTKEAVERSTYVIQQGFTDIAQVAVTPNSVVWTLSDGNGVVINSRENVVAAPAVTVNVVLTGADLALQEGEDDGRLVRRIFTIEATYSSTEGSGLALNEEYEFMIRPLKKVP